MKKKRKPGAPTKLTPEVQDRICKALLSCCSKVGSAAYGGISYQTMLNWMKRGEKAGHGQYFEFFEAVKKALDESEALLISEIRAHGQKQWVALAWLAERRWRDRWARPKQIEITGKDGGPVKGELTGDAKQLMELFKDIDDAKDKK